MHRSPSPAPIRGRVDGIRFRFGEGERPSALLGGVYTIPEIADHSRMPYSVVSRAVHCLGGPNTRIPDRKIPP